MDGDKAKDAAAKHAVSFIKSGMKVGLGTGSTSALFIKHLIQRCQEGLKISALATSSSSAKLAEAGHIPLLDPQKVQFLDIAVDGADEIDPHKNMIKGGGGALLREKIIAKMAKEMVVIVDEKKCVERLGAFPLPVEILPFGLEATLHELHKFKPTLRKKEGKIFITDNGNYIADLSFPYLNSLVEIESQLHQIPGVMATGLFLNLAGRVIVGYADGKVKIH